MLAPLAVNFAATFIDVVPVDVTDEDRPVRVMLAAAFAPLTAIDAPVLPVAAAVELDESDNMLPLVSEFAVMECAVPVPVYACVTELLIVCAPLKVEAPVNVCAPVTASVPPTLVLFVTERVVPFTVTAPVTVRVPPMLSLFVTVSPVPAPFIVTAPEKAGVPDETARVRRVAVLSVK